MLGGQLPSRHQGQLLLRGPSVTLLIEWLLTAPVAETSQSAGP